MTRVVLAIIATLVIMHLGAFLAYGAFSAFLALELPGDVSPAEMFASVFLQKLGLAIAFVMLFFVAQTTWLKRWFMYAAIWWVMFAVMEIGQAIGPHYSATEAVSGAIAETIYCPLSAFVTARFLMPLGAGVSSGRTA